MNPGTRGRVEDARNPTRRSDGRGTPARGRQRRRGADVRARRAARRGGEPRGGRGERPQAPAGRAGCGGRPPRRGRPPTPPTTALTLQQARCAAAPSLVERVPALAALVLVTAVWGVTFVQVKDAVALYPLFAFLAVRFAIASVTLAPVAARRVRGLGRRGVAAGTLLGLLLATGYALQTAGLERTSVSNAGFVTGLYVVFTPLLALVLFRLRIGAAAWVGVAVATGGLALLSGLAEGGSAEGDLLVLARSGADLLPILLPEGFARGHDPG